MNTMKRLSGRTAIVTGAAEGIGSTYAKALAAEGANVCLADCVAPDKVVAAIKRAKTNDSGDAIGQLCDVSDPEQITAMVRATEEAFGGVQILVNNAAVYARITQTPFDQLTNEQWERALSVNVRGVYECVKAVLPIMRRQAYGKVINVTSGTVFRGTTGMLHYVASKGAVLAMTRSMANELGCDGIRCNCIAPGAVMTEEIAALTGIDPIKKAVISARALKRAEAAEDLVGTLIYLASQDSDFVTGQTIVVDGGTIFH
jgi:NAD(P)-dependent dehydrogenase (short-subunit alcohol dehydrogenase family)